MKRMDPASAASALTFFPEPSQVFADPVDKHLEHFHPFASIDLSQFDDAPAPVLHIVCPLDPWEGYVGDNTHAHHSEFLGPNWITFEVIDNRYRFLGDFRYFLLENEEDERLLSVDGELTADEVAWRRQDMQTHYEKVNADYAEKRQRFRTDGWTGKSPIEQFGGRPWDANWTGYPPPPSAFTVSEAGPEPSDPDPERANTLFAVRNAEGRELTFIAAFDGLNCRWSYSEPGSTLLFFDAEAQHAVFTFDIT